MLVSERTALTRCALVLFLAAVTASAQAPATNITVPAGYAASVYYGGFTTPVTTLCQDAQGHVYAADLNGNILRLIDADNDGVAESSVLFWPGTGMTSVTNISWIANKLYVSHLGTITTLEDTDNDGVADVATDIVTGLPYGFHQNNAVLADGPNHILICMGSSQDVGPETDARNAAILRCDLNGGNLQVWASGIRNCFRIARHPVTGEIFGGDNEWNQHPTLPLRGDEINRYQQGQNYGYPIGFGPPLPGQTFTGPAVLLPPDVAPTGIAFNPNTAISGYKDEAFVTLFTTNVATVARVPLWYGPLSGIPQGVAEIFATGFVHPIDVLFLSDGSMLIADFDFGVSLIYRIRALHPVTMTVMNSPTIGTTCALRVAAPQNPGAVIYIAASDAPVPTFALSAGVAVNLNIASPLFALSLAAGNGIFNFPVPGVCDAAGTYTASISIPDDPALVGYRVWLASAVFDPVTFAPLGSTPEMSMLAIPQF